MAKDLNDLDAVLNAKPTSAPVGTGLAALDKLLGMKPKAEAVDGQEIKGKARLNGENQMLTAVNARLSMFVRVLAGVTAVLLLIIGSLVLYIRGTDARKFRQAFQVLAYREGRTLQANAIVLAEYSTNLRAIRDEVTKLSTITEEERQVRLKALASTILEADNLRDGFLKLMKDNDKERGSGASFEYRDPFLKRPIKFDEELGGDINLDKLRDEVKATAKMDDAMKELRSTMLDPIPIAEQMRAEAKRQNAPMIGPDGPVDREKLMQPGTTPLQKLPGMQ